jgi:hypothetical protein
MPSAGADPSRTVGWRGPRLVDRELELVRAAPAAKAGASPRDAALVEEPDVQRVPAGDGWIGIDAVVVAVANVDLPSARRHRERHVRIAALVVAIEAATEDNVGFA